MKWLQKWVDYNTCYFIAWGMIILSPIWLPVYLAVKVHKFGKK